MLLSFYKYEPLSTPSITLIQSYKPPSFTYSQLLSVFVLHLAFALIMSDEVVYHHAPKTEEQGESDTNVTTVEQSDRGLFGFGKKKEEEKSEDAAISSEFEQKVHVSETEPEEKKGSLLEKLRRSDSSSSSSSDEEDENGEKKKKKKPLKETIKEKIEAHKEKKEEEKIEKHEADTYVPVEKYDETVPPPSHTESSYPTPTPAPEEKKGFMEKIKEKLPGHKKTEEEHVAVTAPPPAPVAHEEEGEHKEKKGILEKIKEKIPGYHAKSEEEKEKEKVKESD